MRIRSERLTWRQIGDELVALDLETSTYFTANSAGSVIVRLLSDGATVPQLVSALVAEFKVDADTAQADVEGFLLSLEQHGLLDDEDEG